MKIIQKTYILALKVFNSVNMACFNGTSLPGELYHCNTLILFPLILTSQTSTSEFCIYRERVLKRSVFNPC